MMGLQKSADTLSALLTLAADPAKVQAHVVKLQEAAVAHKQARDASLRAKAEAAEAVKAANARRVEVDQYAERVKQGLLVSANKTDADVRAFEANKRAQNEAIKNAQAKITADIQAHQAAFAQLTTARADLAKAVTAHEENTVKVRLEHTRKENEFSARDARLTMLSAALTEREQKIALAEADLTQRINKMRSLAAS